MTGRLRLCWNYNRNSRLPHKQRGNRLFLLCRGTKMVLKTFLEPVCNLITLVREQVGVSVQGGFYFIMSQTVGNSHPLLPCGQSRKSVSYSRFYHLKFYHNGAKLSSKLYVILTFFVTLLSPSVFFVFLYVDSVHKESF